MIDRKDLVIVVLAGFLLAVTLYPNITTSMGQNVNTNSEPEYDPWADMNEDGKIRVDDITYVALLFGANGDPTKNVVINQYNTETGDFTETLGPWDWYWFFVETEGYREITIFLDVDQEHVSVIVTWYVTETTDRVWETFDVTPIGVFKTYKVRGVRLWVSVKNPSSTPTIDVEFSYYMTT